MASPTVPLLDCSLNCSQSPAPDVLLELLQLLQLLELLELLYLPGLLPLLDFQSALKLLHFLLRWRGLEEAKEVGEVEEDLDG